MSPKLLSSNSQWMPVLRNLAKKNFISALCVEESHTVRIDGDSFRPVFIESMKTFNALYELLSTKCPGIAISATF